MAKDKTMYVCSECGCESAKWLGKCPTCGAWSTFREIKVAADYGTTTAKHAAMSIRKGQKGALDNDARHNRPVRLRDISHEDEPRIDTHDQEFNRVLGGGIVPGSITLLGGEPGIGKSTLTLQTILGMPERTILYVSGEESSHQIKMRADRLQPTDPSRELPRGEVYVLCETSLENIFTQLQELSPDLLIIDSIQTIATDTVDSSPGSITQVRECAAALLRFAKTSGIPVMLIGHINKEGTLPGQRFWSISSTR